MLFDGLTGVVRVLFVGVAAYAALVIFLRISGKRTLSKMNAFDLVVTVALGSTLATVVLSKDVALAEGVSLPLECEVEVRYRGTPHRARVVRSGGRVRAERGKRSAARPSRAWRRRRTAVSALPICRSPMRRGLRQSEGRAWKRQSAHSG